MAISKRHSIGLMAAFAFSALTAAQSHAKVDFEKQVWPVIKEHCVKCHGIKKVKGKLRLDTPEEILAGAGKPGKKDPILIKGKHGESSLWERVSLPKDDDDIMPPADDGDPLTQAQQDLIKAWINEGADFGSWKGDAAATHKDTSLISTLKATPGDAKAIKALNDQGILAMPIANNTNLVMVDFRGVADKTNDASLAALKPLAGQIAWVNLAKTKVTDAGLAHLAGMKNLNRLHLEKTGIGDAGLAKLKGATNLEYLNVYGTKVSDSGLVNLKGLTNLKKLFVWQSQVTKDGAKNFEKSIKGLKVNNGWDGPAVVIPTAKASGPDIGEIMKKAHKSKLLDKVLKNQANANEKKELIKQYELFAKTTAPKGDKKAYAAKTKQILELAKKVVAGDKKQLGPLKSAANCKACHDKHKP